MGACNRAAQQLHAGVRARSRPSSDAPINLNIGLGEGLRTALRSNSALGCVRASRPAVKPRLTKEVLHAVTSNAETLNP